MRRDFSKGNRAAFRITLGVENAWGEHQFFYSEWIWETDRSALKIKLCLLQRLSVFDVASKLAIRLIEREGSWGIIENVRPDSAKPVVFPQAIIESGLLLKVSE